MVSATASSLKAVETVDSCLGRLSEAVARAGGTLVITADHGNAEMMRDSDTGEPHTAHTLNPVPFYVYAPGLPELRINAAVKRPRLANVAATVLQLLGYRAPEGYEAWLLAV